MFEEHRQHGRDDDRPIDLVALDEIHHLARFEDRLKDRHPADGRDAENAAHGGGVEHGRLVEIDAAGGQVDRHGDVVEVQQLGPLVEQHALGQAGRAAGVHEDHRVVLFGLLGERGVAGGDHVLVGEVGAEVPVAHEDHLVQHELVANRGDGPLQMIGEHRVDEDHGHLGVREDELDLAGREPDVERIDDAAAQKGGVVELKELVAVGAQDGEPVSALQPELPAHRVGEAQHAVGMLGVVGVVVAVVEPHRRCPAFPRGVQDLRPHELFHEHAPLPWPAGRLSAAMLSRIPPANTSTSPHRSASAKHPKESRPS